MLTKVFYLNEQGNRKNIEDAIFPTPGSANLVDKLFIVCDGVGGHSKGEEASRIACDSISKYILNLPTGHVTNSDIQASVESAIASMHEYTIEYPEAEQMGTTLTFTYIQDNGVWVAWCGDSRIYHIRNGKILWESKDHSLVQQLIDAGDITEEEALHHPQKNIILRSLSPKNLHTKLDIYFLKKILPGDYLLLCTDGILENIDKSAIYNILKTNELEQNKQKLFLNYCKGKTSDNFSMYLLQFGKLKPIKQPIKSIYLAILFTIIIVIAGVVSYSLLNNVTTSKEIYKPLQDSLQANKKELNTETKMLKMLEHQIKNSGKKNR